MQARDVMTKNVLTIAPRTAIGDIARLLLERRISGVPVVSDDGALLGIVSRANLLHGLAAGGRGAAASVSADDRSLGERVTETLEGRDWVTHGVNVVVVDGAVELWGWVESEEERKAMLVATEGIEGVRGVEDHLGSVAPWVWGT